MPETTYAVLLTYYNEGPIFTQTLESLRAQKIPPAEIWIYDDCSTDVPGPYIPAGLAVRTLRGERNVGPSCGRNRLLERTRADFVHFHDADDLFHPQWSERVMGALRAKPIDMVFTEVGTPNGDPERVMGLEAFPDTYSLVAYCLRGAILTSAGTYRRETVVDLGAYREDLWQSEDYEFHLRLASAGLAFTVIPDPLVIRLRGAGRSQQKEEVWSCALQALDLIAPQLDAQFHQPLADAYVRVASRLYRLGLREMAHTAYRRALDFGEPRAESRGAGFDALARWLGPERAEQVSEVCRSMVPARIRRMANRRRAA